MSLLYLERVIQMAIYTQLKENDIQEIVDHYDLTIIDFQAIAAGATNSSYLLQTPRGSFVLTVFEDKTLDQVIELGLLLLLLEEHDAAWT